MTALKRDPQVESITADGAVHSTTSQTSPTWGLDRIDQRPTVGDGQYRYASTGAGVTAYIVDTGIRFSHSEFRGAAVSGYDFVDDDADASDCDGHGTHIAGTVGGATYGVAKGVNLVGVRVLDCEGSGTVSGVIAGIDWVATHHSGPSVLNMSLGGGSDDALDQAVAAATAAGVTVVVAAGNDDDDACYSSPAGRPAPSQWVRPTPRTTEQSSPMRVRVWISLRRDSMCGHRGGPAIPRRARSAERRWPLPTSPGLPPDTCNATPQPRRARSPRPSGPPRRAAQWEIRRVRRTCCPTLLRRSNCPARP